MSLDRSRWNVQYMQRVLATDPIAYWMQDEKQGLVSYDMVTARSDAARNGAYTGVTLGQPGIGDGRTSPRFDGANDFDDVFTPSFQAAFNGNAGTFTAWMRVFNVGVWTDGAGRAVVTFRVDGNNEVHIVSAAVNNQLVLRYRSGGVSQVTTLAGQVFTDWAQVGITWDKAVDEVRTYLRGIQQGPTLNGLGVWAGNLNAGTTCIGSFNNGAILPWNGWLQHPVTWDYALTPAEMLSLGVL